MQRRRPLLNDNRSARENCGERLRDLCGDEMDGALLERTEECGTSRRVLNEWPTQESGRTRRRAERGDRHGHQLLRTRVTTEREGAESAHWQNWRARCGKDISGHDDSARTKLDQRTNEGGTHGENSRRLGRVRGSVCIPDLRNEGRLFD